MGNKRSVKYKELMEFCVRILEKNGFPSERSTEIASVLVEADARGIPSHGVARLGRYIKEKEEGFIIPDSIPEILFETKISTVFDGKKGPGQSVSIKAMESCIKKAEKSMVAFCSVNNSNHYGISAYYAEIPLSRNMIGIAMTNSYPLVVPTFGKEAVLGTNPFSVCLPGVEHPFKLDMATSVVTRGKIEVYDRHDENIPSGWAVDENGKVSNSPKRIIGNFDKKMPGGLLSLGGVGEVFGGHKGFGLALLVDLLSAGLSCGKWSSETYTDGQPGVCHFFAAIDLNLFGDPEKIKQKIQDIMDGVTDSERASGETKIYYHGEKEIAKREEYAKEGIPIFEKTAINLLKLARMNNIPAPEGLV